MKSNILHLSYLCLVVSFKFLLFAGCNVLVLGTECVELLPMTRVGGTFPAWAALVPRVGGVFVDSCMLGVCGRRRSNALPHAFLCGPSV